MSLRVSRAWRTTESICVKLALSVSTEMTRQESYLYRPQLVDEVVHVDRDEANVFRQPFRIRAGVCRSAVDTVRPGWIGLRPRVNERRGRSQERVEKLGIGQEENAEETLERLFAIWRERKRCLSDPRSFPR